MSIFGSIELRFDRFFCTCKANPPQFLLGQGGWGARPMEEKLAKERGDAYSWDGFILYIIEMTTITVTKSNAQEVVSIIMQRIERGDFLIDLYDNEIYNPIVRSGSSDEYLNVLDDMIEEDAYHRA